MLGRDESLGICGFLGFFTKKTFYHPIQGAWVVVGIVQWIEKVME